MRSKLVLWICVDFSSDWCPSGPPAPGPQFSCSILSPSQVGVVTWFLIAGWFVARQSPCRLVFPAGLDLGLFLTHAVFGLLPHLPQKDFTRK